jgi:hypothetical protein
VLLPIDTQTKTMTPRDAEQDAQPAAERRGVGRDELNLAEFPLTLLAKRIPKGRNTLVYEDVIRDQNKGEPVSRRLTITGDEKYGLPTTLDDDVIIGLIQITRESNNFSDRTVPFSRFRLIELLGWPDTGQSLKRLDESLNRWLGVTLRYEKAWWDKIAQSWMNEGFHILDNISLYDREMLTNFRRSGSQFVLPFSSFTWNKVVFRSFAAENLKRLDLTIYFGLSHPAAKRAYRFLDKRFYRSKSLVFDLRDFLSRNYDTGKLKEKLQPALEELEAAGFLEPMTRQQRYTKKGPKDWRINLAMKGAAKAAPSFGSSVIELPFQSVREAPPEGLVGELVHRNVTLATAEELAARFSADVISAKIEVFDWLLSKKDKKVTTNPAGYLVDSIRKGYVIPKGFVSKAEKQAKAAAEAEAQQKAEQIRLAKLEQKARDAEQDRLLQQRADEYLAGLSPTERDEIEKAALGDGAGGAMFFRESLIREHVIQLLNGS